MGRIEIHRDPRRLDGQLIQRIPATSHSVAHVTTCIACDTYNDSSCGSGHCMGCMRRARISPLLSLTLAWSEANSRTQPSVQRRGGLSYHEEPEARPLRPTPPRLDAAHDWQPQRTRRDDTPQHPPSSLTRRHRSALKPTVSRCLASSLPALPRPLRHGLTGPNFGRGRPTSAQLRCRFRATWSTEFATNCVDVGPCAVRPAPRPWPRRLAALPRSPGMGGRAAPGNR